jgi:phosphoketolase
MEVAATAEQRQKMKDDKIAEKTAKRQDKEKLHELQNQDRQNKKIAEQNADDTRKLSILVSDAITTNPMRASLGAPDEQLRTHTGSSSQKVEI